MKIKIAAFALLLSGAICCSDSYGNDLLGRMMGRAGCGCDAAPTCCDTPAMACGGRSFSMNLLGGRGFLAGRCGRGIGCGTYANAGCGCDQVTASTSCCDPCGRGLFNGRLRGRLSGLRNRGGNAFGCDSGCGGFVSAGCGTDAGFGCADPCASGGLLSGLRGRMGSFGNAGCCDSAPIAAGCGTDMGCCDPCASSRCGLGIRDRLAGLRGRFGNRGGFDSCGCGAPVAAGCGCNDGGFADACGCGFGRPSILDRLRSRGGMGLGSCCDAGCGGQAIAAGCGCNGGYINQAAPTHAEPAMEENGIVAPPTGETGQIRVPRVDPQTFQIRSTGYRN